MVLNLLLLTPLRVVEVFLAARVIREVNLTLALRVALPPALEVLVLQLPAPHQLELVIVPNQVFHMRRREAEALLAIPVIPEANLTLAPQLVLLPELAEPVRLKTATGT